MEGSRLSHDQTRWIFETMTVGKLAADIPVDDIIETSNHFRCIDKVIGSSGAQLTERYIKSLHFLLKNGTSDSRKAWFAVGDYKRLEKDTCRTGQDIFVLGLRQFGHMRIAEAVEKTLGVTR